MNALVLHFHLRSPLLITELGGGDPNSGIGHSYLPGSAIRGAVIGQYLQAQAVDAAEPTFRRLFLDGAVRFLNGYLLTPDEERMLPTPLSWQRPKDAPGDTPAHDWAWGAPKSTDTTATKAWKGIGGRFCRRTATEVFCSDPTMQINIHIAREDRQRPTSGNATIFRYDALAEGQRFGAVILGEDPADLRIIASLLPHGTILNIGRSQSAGYGWVEVCYPKASNGQPDAQVLANWQEVALEQPASAPAERLVVTLLSDALIQEPQSGAYVAELEPVIGQPCQRAFARLRTVGGFNRKWNLPLPQTQAISAGSVFVYPYSPALAAKLASLVTPGIGARCAEGFGRIAVNWQSGAVLPLTKAISVTPQPLMPTLTTGRVLATRMVERMVRANLDRQLLTAINEFSITRRGLRNSQLARIRVVARHAMEPTERAQNPTRLTQLADFLAKMKESGRSQLQRARIENEPLYEWLLKLADKPETVWDLLRVDPATQPSIGNCPAELTPALAVEYALRLIDSVAQLATREESND